jgi:hypothetical protein
VHHDAMSLRPCPGCTRHVRASESACPFCATALPASEESPSPESASRPGSRHAVLFGVAAGAIAISTALLGTACAAYGGPAPSDAGPPTDSGAGR